MLPITAHPCREYNPGNGVPNSHQVGPCNETRYPPENPLVLCGLINAFVPVLLRYHHTKSPCPWREYVSATWYLDTVQEAPSMAATLLYLAVNNTQFVVFP